MKLVPPFQTSHNIECYKKFPFQVSLRYWRAVAKARPGRETIPGGVLLTSDTRSTVKRGTKPSQSPSEAEHILSSPPYIPHSLRAK